MRDVKEGLTYLIRQVKNCLIDFYKIKNNKNY